MTTAAAPRQCSLDRADDPAVVDLLRALVEQVKGLRADLTRDREGPLRQSTAALVLTLTASVADRAFSAREVIAHAATVDGELRAALDAAGLSNPRQLGKFLRGIEGRVIAGVRLERIGLDRDGIIWRVWRV